MELTSGTKSQQRGTLAPRDNTSRNRPPSSSAAQAREKSGAARSVHGPSSPSAHAPSSESSRAPAPSATARIRLQSSSQPSTPPDGGATVRATGGAAAHLQAHQHRRHEKLGERAQSLESVEGRFEALAARHKAAPEVAEGRRGRPETARAAGGPARWDARLRR